MAWIELTQGKRALVDDEDLESLSQFKWHYHCNYAYRTIPALRKNRHIRIGMHRDILKPNPNMVCDHINGDTLDNRKQNLREATISQNNMNKGNQRNNTSGYKGVCWNIVHNKFYAYITLNRKRISLGYFKCAKQAAQAYNEAAVKLHGDFAKLNRIDFTIDDFLIKQEA